MTTNFDLSDLMADDVANIAADDQLANEGNPELAELNEWAEKQLSGSRDSDTATGEKWFIDIETGPLPEPALRAIYHEKTLDEFSATCDKRWKPDTVAVKYEEYKATAWEEFVGKAALSPVTGRVLMIGISNGLHDQMFTYLGLDVEESWPKREIAMLEFFWLNVEAWLANKSPIIGHNSNGFDLPFLVRRSWILGVPVPREVRAGRYWHPLFRDTMEAWFCGERGYIKLNDLAAVFGLGQKTEGIKGADFYKWWFGQMDPEECGVPADQQRTKAIEYNEQDIMLTAAIAARMGMV